MPMGEGYWLNARTGEEVEVWEHAKHVIDNPELFGLSPQAVSGKQGAMYAQDADLRRQLLTDVMKRDWIRVRSHRGRHVFETAGLDDDALYSILEFAQRHNMWDNEQIMINDVTKPEGHGTTTMTVGQLQKQFGLGEQLTNVRKTAIGIVELWSQIEPKSADRDRLKEMLTTNVDLVAGWDHAAWSLRETKDRDGNLKFEVQVYNRNVETCEQLDTGRFQLSSRAYKIQNSDDVVREITEMVAHCVEQSAERVFPAQLSGGTLQCECRTVKAMRG